MDTLCAIVPQFLVALARREQPELGERPVVVGRSSELRGSVVTCSMRAARAGVAPGMLLSRALVLCPDAAVVTRRPEQVESEARAFVALAAGLFPAVEAIDPGHIHADIRGLPRMFRMAASDYLEDVQEALAGRSGLPVRVGAARSVFAAHCAAGWLAEPVMLLEDRDCLGPLPVEALPVAVEMHQRLRLFGLTRLEQVGALPPAALQAQFGREGMRAWRLIHGEEPGRIAPSREAVRVEERIDLPTPAVLGDPLILATEILLQRALRRREVDGRAVRRVDWVAELENGERLPMRVVFHEPVSDQSRMLFALRNRIERLTLAAPAVAVELIFSGICSEYARQERLWQDGLRAREALTTAIEQLNVRGNGPQIYRITEVEPWSRLPERQRAMVAFSP